jgi:uncharacterized OB-fold protein
MSSPSADDPPSRPRPTPTLESRPYWEGLRAHCLRLQACAACGKLRHYPRPVCDACYSMDSTWREARGDGRVHSWTVAHHPFHPALKAAVPYAVVTVDLPEGVRMAAPFRGDPALLRIDLPVNLLFEDVDATLTLPAFAPR